MCVVFDVVFVKCVKFMCKDIVEVLKMVMGECVEVFCWVFGFVDGEQVLEVDLWQMMIDDVIIIFM